MTLSEAHSIIGSIGNAFAEAMIKFNHTMPDSSMLMHGLAAYIKLNLEGEWPQVDEAYNVIIDSALADYKKLCGA
jgi:hypothetical protein